MSLFLCKCENANAFRDMFLLKLLTYVFGATKPILYLFKGQTNIYPIEIKYIFYICINWQYQIDIMFNMFTIMIRKLKSNDFDKHRVSTHKKPSKLNVFREPWYNEHINKQP